MSIVTTAFSPDDELVMRIQQAVVDRPRLRVSGTIWLDVAVDYGAYSPPSIGCLLALAREAWADYGIAPIQHPAPSGGYIWMCRGERWCAKLHSTPLAPTYWTEAEALAAALEASPCP